MKNIPYTNLTNNQGKAADLCEKIRDLQSRKAAIELGLQAAKAQLRSLLIELYFKQGCSPPQGIQIPNREGGIHRVCIPQSIRTVDKGALPSFAAGFFEERMMLKAAFKTPEKASLGRLKANVESALSGHGEPTWRERTIPVNGFHKDRFELFSPEQNIAIDMAAPLQLRILP